MSDQTTFGFASMTAAEIKDDAEQMRLPLEAPKGKEPTDDGIHLVPCTACGGSTFDDGERPLVCHCGARVL